MCAGELENTAEDPFGHLDLVCTNNTAMVIVIVISEVGPPR